MKTTLTLLAIMASLTAFAQNPLQIVVVGDTVELRVTGAHASIQWQQSTDSLTWTDITGLTDSIEVFLATSSPTNKRFYKAKITDALCPNATPFYSSVIRHKIITSAAQIRNDKKAIVLADLHLLLAYVQTIADANPKNAETIIISSGFDVKHLGSHGKETISVKPKKGESGTMTM